jgi:hypothetical protein
LSITIRKNLKTCNIADTSTCGWETERQYEINPIPIDSDNESKIYKVETRTLKRKRSSSHGKDVVMSSFSCDDVSSYTGAKFKVRMIFFFNPNQRFLSGSP